MSAAAWCVWLIAAYGSTVVLFVAWVGWAGPRWFERRKWRRLRAELKAEYDEWIAAGGELE